MTIREVAQRIGKSEISVRRLIKADKLKATLIDGAYQISEEALTDYLHSYQSGQAAPNELISQLRSEVLNMGAPNNFLICECENVKW